MSAQLISPNELAYAVNAMLSYYDECFGSENPHERALGNELHKVLESASQSPVKSAPMAPEKLKLSLFEALGRANMAHYIETYPDTKEALSQVSGDADRIFKQSTDQVNEPVDLKRGGACVLKSVLDHLLYNTGEPGACKIHEAVQVFTGNLASIALKLSAHYDQPEADFPELMEDVLSMLTHGDKFYGLQSGFKTLTQPLQSAGINAYNSLVNNYPGEVFAHIAKSCLMGDGCVQIVPNGTCSQLAPLSAHIGRAFKIQSDIPAATNRSAFRVARLFDQMNQKIQSLPADRFGSVDGEELSHSAVIAFKELFGRVKANHDQHLLMNLPEYRRASTMIARADHACTM